jgi:sugar/nucleoside kinase (ribokinase family)
MTLKLVTMGDLVADLIVPITQLPLRHQEHQIARDIAVEAGSTGSVLIVAARLGLCAQALGVVGQDFYGNQVLATLTTEGVDVGSVVSPPGSRTTTSIVLIDDAAQHVFVWMRGTGEPQPFADAWRASVEQADAIFTTGYALQPPAAFSPAAVHAGLDIAHARNIPIFFDLGPVTAHVGRAEIDAVIRRTTVFLATSEEITDWMEIDDPRAAARQLLAQGPVLAIVKLGGQGCLVVTAEQCEYVDAFRVAVRNTAGAGDAFGAACVYGYLKGFSIRQIGIFANAVGGLAVTKLGTGTRLPPRQEIAQLLLEHGHTFFESR